MHEHLDEMGVVHMNGRIYDPLIGRFMSADPFIQAPSMLQSYNRYSYVMNNPLNLTDPSGYFSWRKLIGYATYGMYANSSVARTVITMAACYYGGPAGCAAATAVNAYVSGATTHQALKSGGIAFLTAGAFYLAGGVAPAGVDPTSVAAAESLERYAAHAAAGCVSAAMGGGQCGTGAVAAVFGKFATNATQSWGVGIAQGAAAVIAGGVGSVIAGGKFENGAKTAAFGYLFNEVGSATQRGYADSTNARGASVLFGPSEMGGTYDRRVFVLDSIGNVIASYEGSVTPDPGMKACANGCPTIAVGDHGFVSGPSNSYGQVLILGNNGVVPTAGPNPNQNGNSFATDVFVHYGLSGRTGAMGCLTVNPAQFNAFISHFPVGAIGTLTRVK
jgi:RHS repeat-associated protein